MANEDLSRDQLSSEIESLRQRNEYLEAQNEALVDGLMVIGPNGRIISSNRSMREMWEIPESDWNSGAIDTVLQSMLEKLVEPESFADLFNRLSSDSQEKSSGYIYLVDGRCFETQSAPIANDGDSSVHRLWLFRDISMHKKVEEALAHNEATLTAMLETAVDGIITADGKGVILSFNVAAEAIFGYREKDVIGKKIKILMAEPYQSEHDGYLSNYHENGIKKIIGIGREVTGRRSDGTEFPLHLAVSEVSTHVGPIFMAIIRDTTEDSRVIEDLKRSEETFRNLYESIPLAYFTGEQDGKFTNVNQYAMDLTGYSREELIGMYPSQLYADTPSGKPRAAELNAKVLAGENIIGEELEMQKADGSNFWVSLSVQPMEGGKSRRALLEDITARKRAQLALEDARANLETKVQLRTAELTEAHNRLKAITANLPGIVFQDILHPDGSHRFTYVSPAVEEILGLDPDEMIHDPDLWKKSVFPDDFESLKTSIFASRDSLEPWKWEGRMYLRNGDLGWFEGLAQPRPLPDGDVQWDGLFLDASERKRAETALQDSEGQFRMVWDSMPVGLRLTTEDGTVVSVNGAYCNLVQMSRDELIGQPFAIIYDPSRHDDIIAKHQVGFREGKPRAQLETQVTLKSGRKIWLRVGNSFFTPPGAEKLLLGMFTDITARKQDESDLVDSDERFRKLSEAAFEGIVTAIDGKIISANEQFANMFGYSHDELAGMMAAQLTHPDFQEVVMDYISRGDESPYEAVAVRKDGTTFPFEAHGTRIPYRGETARVTAVRDITKRKEAERELRATVQKTALHMEQSPLAFIEFNMALEVTAWNKAAQEIFGYTKAEAIGRHVNDLIVPEEAQLLVQDIFDSLAHESGGTRSQNKNRTKDDRIIICEWFNTQLTDENGEVIGVASLADDVTLRVQMESEILRAQKLESVGTLAGGLAHDFNNFLAMILLNVGSAKMQPELGEDTLDLLSAAEQSILKAKAITEQLLAFTRGGEPVKAAADLQPLLQESIEFALHGSPQTYAIDLPPDLWRVNIDSGQINQVINNLVLNAREAMPKGGQLTVTAANIAMTLDATVGTLEPGNYVQVRVADEGAGIAPAIINSIFDPYFSTREGGSGLGLFSCYSILERHGGWITVGSTVGAGSTFTFYLPATAETIEVKRDAAPIPGGGKVLVLDDEEAILKGLENSLHALGYEVELTRDGEAAIRAYREAQESGAPYTAAIFDLTIPGGMGGAESMERLLKLDPNISAIVSSGYSNNPVMANFRQYGFKGTLPKPYSLEQLSEALSKATAES